MSVFDQAFASIARPALDHFLADGAIVYQPAGGGPQRTVRGTVELSNRISDQDGTTVVEEECWLTCDRSATTGISRPAIGDRLRLPEGLDESQREFGYYGPAVDVTANSWRLRFAREPVQRYGTDQKMAR